MALNPAFPTVASQVVTMTEWEQFFTGPSWSGIAPGNDGFGCGLLPSLDGGARTVNYTAGAAFVRGFFIKGSSGSLAIPVASGQPRIDRLVLRLNRAAVTAADWLKPVVVAGTPAASPVPPALVNTTGGLWDLPICRWTSQTSGAVNTLVDERFGIAPGVLVFHSSQRPQPNPVEQCLGIEWDTHKVVLFDGATWRTVSSDSGDLPVTATAGWLMDFTNRVRVINGNVSLLINLKRTGATLAEGTAGGFQLMTIPAAARATVTNYFAAIFSGDVYGRLEIRGDGTVWLLHPSADIPTNALLRLTCNYMI